MAGSFIANTQKLQGTLSIDSSKSILAACWWKPTLTLIATNYLFSMASDAAQTDPQIKMFIDAAGTTTGHLNYRTTTALGAATTASTTAAAWNLLGFGFNTSQAADSTDGVAHNVSLWINATKETTTKAGANTAAAYATVCIGQNMSQTSAFAHGLMRDMAIWVDISSATMDSIMTSFLTTRADSITPLPNFLWPMDNSAAPKIGNITLTNTGTVTFPTTDEPVLAWAPTRCHVIECM
jgi:hypothetical protein